MKHLSIFFVFFCCICVMLCDAYGDCKKNSDCKAGECCVNTPPFARSTCQKYLQQGEFCAHMGKYNPLGKYINMCPCGKGLKCQLKDVSGPLALFRSRMLTCV
uniref:U3-aranetoxin-Ce1a n=1 Tax=Caerostris extrusa TaxID=172846 RepID=TXCA_CAEEX|nr:RecName: Full=U3-aranetoxin-Ce1a; Short=U3-AATX-Ce1a; AltName: Full=Neurotoxic peptide caeron; Flags: Precursor [Caerostris extrusa]AAL12487.1 neurotoxic peptide Caeron precursor [Caerostris extrusa]